jgi:DNA-binding MarR family transcriptional regulator
VNETRANSSNLDAEAEITLGVLTAVERSDRVTQRSMASELGIALGLANAYLKRCIKKGFIKVAQAPANRYLYYLTPTGFAEKGRLTARYLAISFNFFRAARAQCTELFDACEAKGWRRIAFFGASDLVEIAGLCLGDRDIAVVGLVDPRASRAAFAGLAVFPDLKSAGPVDAIVITDIETPQAAYEAALREAPPERVLAPRFLNVSRRQPPAA